MRLVFGMAPLKDASLYQQRKDEKEYFEKIKELERYLDPLKELLVEINYHDREKMKKVGKLIYILSNTDKVCVSMETLLKCEKALETNTALCKAFAPSTNTVVSPSRGKVRLSIRTIIETYIKFCLDVA